MVTVLWRARALPILLLLLFCSSAAKPNSTVSTSDTSHSSHALMPHTNAIQEPLYIFITQDGNIYRSNGQTFQFLYNIGTTIVSGHQALTSLSDRGYMVFPDLQGYIMLYDKHVGIRRTPLTVKNLTGSTPFASSSYYYTGATTTTLTLLDLISGAAGYMSPTSTTVEVKLKKFSSSAISAKTGLEEYNMSHVEVNLELPTSIADISETPSYTKASKLSVVNTQHGDIIILNKTGAILSSSDLSLPSSLTHAYYYYTTGSSSSLTPHLVQLPIKYALFGPQSSNALTLYSSGISKTGGTNSNFAATLSRSSDGGYYAVEYTVTSTLTSLATSRSNSVEMVLDVDQGVDSLEEGFLREPGPNRPRHGKYIPLPYNIPPSYNTNPPDSCETEWKLLLLQYEEERFNTVASNNTTTTIYIATTLVLLLTSLYFYIMAKPIKRAITTTNTILGHGSRGTVVVEGSLVDGRKVAVKKLPEHVANKKAFEREISLLLKSTSLPHVIYYYSYEYYSNYYYIAMELADGGSVREFISKCTNSCCSNNTNDVSYDNQVASNSVLLVLDRRQVKDCYRAACKQAVLGVYELHSIGIVHRDIKPDNLLLTTPPPTAPRCCDSNSLCYYHLKLSDLGISKHLTSLTTNATTAGYGTVGWQAPEILQQADLVLPLAADVFSLGLLLHYLLLHYHPYGRSNVAIVEALQNRQPPQLDNLKTYCYLAYDLVHHMLNYEPKKRPSAGTVLSHPFFWPATLVVSFFDDFSNRLESESVTSLPLLLLEYKSSDVIGTNWDTRLHPELIADSLKRRSYDFNSVADLIRLMRNKKQHFQQLPDFLQQEMSLYSGFLSYFETRFPKLLMHCVEVACVCFGEELVFEKYVKELAIFYQSHGKFKNASGDNAVEQVVFWYGSKLSQAVQCRGWYRNRFTSSTDMPQAPSVPTTPVGYKTSLCEDYVQAMMQQRKPFCPYRDNCHFAHGVLELKTIGKFNVVEPAIAKLNSRRSNSTNNRGRGRGKGRSGREM